MPMNAPKKPLAKYIAPEAPMLTKSLKLTVFPLCPISNSSEIQRLSTRGLVPPRLPKDLGELLYGLDASDRV